MAITALPTPPSRQDPTNFATRADAFLGALPTFATEANALQTDVNGKQVTASAAANTATTKAAEALASANASAASATQSSGFADASQASAVASAASAASAAAMAGAFAGTSTSSVAIGLGNKSFTTQTGEQYTAGIYMTAVSAANNGNFVYGQVVSYSGSTLVINVQATGGSGTYADWNLSLAGVRGAPGTGITPQAVGFTMAGGTTSRTMTVDADLVVSDLKPVAKTGSYNDLIDKPVAQTTNYATLLKFA